MSSSSSIVSKFQFESYKVDSFSFNMSKSINVLLYKGAFLEKDWKFNFSLVKPVLFKDSQKYLSGIKCNIVLQPAEGEKLLELNASISGLFSIEPGVPKDTLINVAKYQFPTILFPYLRSTVTSFFANAGFGTFIFPLINVVELAKKLLTDNEIEEL